MDIQQIILLITPVIVWVVTWMVKNLFSKLPGWAVVGIVVPLISLALALITNAISIGDNFWLQLAVGVIAVFINEIKKQIQTK